MKIDIKKISSPEDVQKCLKIRFEVLVIGQNVPFVEEIDGKDEKSDHYLLKVDEEAVGVTRVRWEDDYAKIERVAILKQFQNKGFGKKLMEFILEYLKKNPQVKSAKLSSQTYAIPFYEKLGFTVCGSEYLDANIPHKDMQKLFN